MTTFNTSSGFSDLVGTVDITNNTANSYTSNTQGVGNVQDLPGPNLNFNVTFPSVNRTYHVQANANGNGYSGSANGNGPTAAEETWTATGTTADPAEASTPTETATKSA